MDTEQIMATLTALSENQNRLDGRLLATQAAVRALISMQPDPALASQRVAQQLEKLVAAALPQMISEQLISGLADAKQAILPPASAISHPNPR